ncbi:MFS transporter [Saccharothrix violaceirubra]|uniref:MFS family permease n=1 Tax=Saccharothrix violaceirubra TaxID=413306 RepID=A0A7W7T6U0_9PSEU|nr:MFS transporter [Saccharothrix violaceirubra]MBB4967644.1 MFS family permease [Saccharothrix violaceirubra]
MTIPIERTRWGAVVAVALGVVLAALDLTVVGVALPVLGTELHAGPTVTQWVLHAYNLALVALAVPAGRWLDRACPRSAFLLAVGGFGVASVLITVAPDAPLLLAARAVQGVFAGLLGALTIPLVAAVSRPEHRGRAMSLVLALFPVSGVAGPAVGGLLTDAFGWRAVFAINVPLVVLAFVVGRRTIPAKGGLPAPGRRSLVEASVVGVGATALFLGGYWLPLAAVALVIWLRLPQVRPVRTMLRTRASASSLFALPLVVTGIAAVNFVVPYLLAHRSATVAGLVLLSTSAGMAAFSPVGGVLADRFGAARVAFAGAVVVLVGTVALLPLDESAAPWDVAWRLFVLGIGHGLFAGPNSAAILAATPPDLIGTSGGVSTLLRTLGFSLGPALAAAATGFGTVVVALIAVTAAGCIVQVWSQRVRDLPKRPVGP